MGDNYVDLFATKGLEYILVIAFLTTLVVFWRFLNRPTRGRSSSPVGFTPTTQTVEWFALNDNLYYHQGHTWAMPIDEGTVVLGIDDFAQKLLGEIKSIELPLVGTHLEQGEAGFKVHIDSKSINLISPISGEIIALNDKITTSPKAVNLDPYNEGWLMKARVPKLKGNLKNLLSGNLAKRWMDETANELRRRISGNLGFVLQDGGIPVSGIARSLSAEKWDEIAKEFLLSN